MSRKDYDRGFYDNNGAKGAILLKGIFIIVIILVLMNVYSQSVYGVSIVEVIKNYLGR